MPVISGRNLAVILIPILIVAGILAPRILAFLPAVFALITYLVYAARHKVLLFPDKGLCLFFALIAALSFLSILWSDFPENALERSYSTAGILFSGFILFAVAEKFPGIESWPAQKIAIFCALTIASLGLFLYIENRLGFPVGQKLDGDNFMSSLWNRSIVVLSMLIVPCLFLLKKTYGITPRFYVGGSLLIILGGLPLLITQSQTAQILFLVALAGFCLMPFLKKYLLILTAVIAVGLTLAAPLIPNYLSQKMANMEGSFVTRASMPHRLEVWNFVAEKIHESPWVGHGVECVRSMKSAEIMPHIKSDTILHPHNAFLQIWVETGLLGALLTAAFLLFIVRAISRSAEENQPLYYAIFVSSLSLLSTGYGLWQSWQMGLLLAVSALSIVFARILPPEKS